MTVVNRNIVQLNDALDKQFDRLAKAVYSGDVDPSDLDNDLIKSLADNLYGGVKSGYGVSIGAVDYDTPDALMIANLEKDVYWFSSAKTYNELFELNLALLDENGKVRSFSDFKQAAASIHSRYNVNYLNAEYNQAVASSQMAGKWVRIQEDKDTLPYLRFTTAGDERVSPDHALLEGVTKHVDDPFWDTHYPPLRWNCRCDVDQVSEGRVTPDSKIKSPEIPENFKFNVGKRGVVYPPEHPYHDLPDTADKVRINQKAWDILSKESKSYHHVQSFKNGGRVEVHSLADKADLNYNIELSTEVARKGHKVKVRPHSYLNGVKNPEVDIDGLVGDFKEVKNSGTKTAVQTQIKRAAKQKAEAVWLHLTSGDITVNRLKNGIYAALNKSDWNKSIKKVMLIYKDYEIVEIDRADIVNWKFVEKLRKP